MALVRCVEPLIGMPVVLVIALVDKVRNGRGERVRDHFEVHLRAKTDVQVNEDYDASKDPDPALVQGSGTRKGIRWRRGYLPGCQIANGIADVAYMVHSVHGTCFNLRFEPRASGHRRRSVLMP